MTNFIRIDSKYHQALRLDAFNNKNSIQGELDAILSKYFRSQSTHGQ